ncbi:hypothetical protein M569_11682 [Genlisea aurea]|uniref:Uncharacterized protein n=1 Tax=Genlisea aurea TaxID=192259 RepID=S8C8H6_9LAMI|nr:hypothetical protein M569_11682 [Genlisea aurea]
MAEDILIANIILVFVGLKISFLFASLLISVSVMVCSDRTSVCTWTEQYVSFKLTLFA